MAEKSIRERLENWGRYQRGGARAQSGPMPVKETRTKSPYGGQGYKCMTAVTGNVLKIGVVGRGGWSETKSTTSRMTSEEIADAQVLMSAYVLLPEREQSMLKWCYVLNKPPGEICRKLGIPAWPASHFKQELAIAEASIEKAIDIGQQHNIIPSNNSIPSGKTCGDPLGGATVSGGIEAQASPLN